MKKTGFLLLLLTVLFACKNRKDLPDTSGIKLDISIERFDQGFFSIDSNNREAGLQKLAQAYPGFYWDFMQEILGVNGSVTDTKTLLVTKEFLRGYYRIYDSSAIDIKTPTGWKKNWKKLSGM